MNFNYKSINKKFENDKVWVVILKFSILTTLKIMVEFENYVVVNKNFTIKFDINNLSIEIIFLLRRIKQDPT